MKLSRRQMEQPLLADRQALIEDIEAHLAEHTPWVTDAYPKGYLHGIINESLKIAFHFDLSEITYLRMFVDLRWRIAPGYYKQPQIHRILSNAQMTEAEKFETLTSDFYDSAWEEACGFDSPDEWRGHLYEDGRAPDP